MLVFQIEEAMRGKRVREMKGRIHFDLGTDSLLARPFLKLHDPSARCPLSDRSHYLLLPNFGTSALYSCTIQYQKKALLILVEK